MKKINLSNPPHDENSNEKTQEDFDQKHPNKEKSDSNPIERYTKINFESPMNENKSEIPIPNSENLKDSAEKEKEKKNGGILSKYTGMLLTLLASFLFSIGTLIAKVLHVEFGFHSFSTTFWRYLGVAVPGFFLLFHFQWGFGKTKRSVFASVWPLDSLDKKINTAGLVIRGIFGASAVVLRYFSLQYLPIADTMVISYASPALVTILAHFFLKEKCGVVSILSAFITLGGVFVIARPPLLTGAEEFDQDQIIGTVLAIGALICAALIVIITRKIREVHFSLMTLVFGLIGVIEGAALALSFGQFQYPTGKDDTLLILGIAITSFLAQMAIILAVKFEQAGPVALLRTADVLFGFLFQFLFLDKIPDLISGLGAAIVLFGVLLTAFRKWLGLLPEESPMRKTLGFVLR